MNLRWLYNRLRAMGPAELAHRLLEAAKRQTARGRLEGWARYDTQAPIQFPGALGNWLASQAEANREPVEQTTAALLDGRYSVLGVDWPQRRPGALFPAKLWQLDPVSGGSWPGSEQYCFDIPYRHERRLGDVKYVWEINRLQFLQPLAASARTGNAAALGAVEAAIASWFEANPPFRGLAWASGIEVALRAISLLVVVGLLGERLSLTAKRRIGAVLSASLVWLIRFPSLFSSANNHIVAEAAGVFLTATAMPVLPGVAAIKRRWRSIIEREATLQILQDGVPAEQSPTYGAFTAELLHLCELAAGDDDQQLNIGSRLQKFGTFVSWMAEGGHVPAIGDNDEGRVITIAPAGNYVADVAGRFSSGTQASGVHTFETGGYSVVRERRDGHDWHLCLDHGPLGYLSIAAHGHADALALCLTLDREPLLVDPGTYLYHSGGAWRDWFRSTRAHNTLTLGGEDQSTIAGSFNWSHKARAQLDWAELPPAWRLVVHHDGYQRRYGRTHTRVVEPTGEGILITDMLGRPATVELVFQLAPNCMAIVVEGRVLVSRQGAAVAIFSFEPAGALAVSIGEDRLDGGWVSPSFGVKVPAARISWQGQIGNEGVRTTIIATV